MPLAATAVTYICWHGAMQSTEFEMVSDDGNTAVFNLDYMTRWK